MVELKRANINDLELLAELESDNFDENYSKKQISSNLNDENYYIYLAYNDNKLIGYVYFSIIMDTAELLKIAVISNYRNNGFGTQILSNSYKILKKIGVRTLFLEVSDKNHVGIKLYSKLGFKVISRRSRYYSDSADAIIMRKSFD